MIFTALLLLILAFGFSAWRLRKYFEENLYRDALVIATVFGAVVLFGLFAVVATFHDPKAQAPSAQGIAVMLALGSLLGGAVLGFLFGVPRRQQLAAAPKPPADPKSDAASDQTPASPTVPADASNLEQISDWLTKILLGAGLVELQKLPDFLKRASNFLGNGLGGARSDPVAALSIVLAFSAIGFFGSILLTRLFLARAFYEADRRASGVVEKKVGSDEAKTFDAHLRPALEPGQRAAVAFTASSAQDSGEMKDVATEISRIPISRLKTAKDFALWAKAQYARGNFVASVEGYKRAVEAAPRDPQLRTEYAAALAAADLGGSGLAVREQLFVAYSLLNQYGGDYRVVRNVYNALVYSFLYDPPPNGFEAAIKLCEEYNTKYPKEKDDALLLNLACAYGQKVAWLKQSAAGREGKPAEESIEQATKAAYDALQESLRISRHWLPLMQRLLQKEGRDSDGELKDRREDDLEVFEDDPRFRELLELPPRPSVGPTSQV